MKLTVNAGAHARKLAPINVALTAENLTGIDVAAPIALRYDGGKLLPAQLKKNGEEYVLSFVLDWLAKDETASLVLVNADVADCYAAIDLTEEGRVALTANGASTRTARSWSPSS